jgi:hypothetical protein
MSDPAARAPTHPETTATTGQPQAPAPAAPPAPPRAPTPPTAPAAPAPGTAQGEVAAPPRDKKAARFHAAPTTPRTTGLPAMLEIVSNQEYHTTRHDDINAVVPSAIMYFQAISAMDEQMSTTHRFVQSAPAWVPVVSHIYFALLWHWQLLRAFRNSRSIDRDAFEFLDVCERLFDFRSLLVPGPLVPFLQSLTSCAAHFDWYGNISPGIPTIAELGMLPASGYAPGRYVYQLPAPVLFLDVLSQFARDAVRTDADAQSYRWYHTIFLDTWASTRPSRNNTLGPQGSCNHWVPNAQLIAANGFWSSKTTTLPRRFRATATAGSTASGPIDSWTSFTGFHGSDGIYKYSWFSTISRVMQTYCLHFNDSVSLASISPDGLGAIIPIATIQPSSDLRDYFFPATLHQPHERSFPARFEVELFHGDHTLEELPEQYAALTQPNIDMSLLEEQNDHEPVRDTDIRTGSFWTQPEVRRSTRLNVHTAYAQMISSRYHNATASRR